MSARRHLVQGQRSSDVTPARRRPEERQTTALPPYEPPRFPLSQKHQLELARFKSSHDYDKFKKHIKASITSLTNCTGDAYERVYDAKGEAEKATTKRKKAEEDPEDTTAESKAEAEKAALLRVEELEGKVNKLARDAEKALRELIDYGDEMASHTQLFESLQDEIALNAESVPRVKPQPAARPAASRMHAHSDSESEGEHENEMEVDEPNLPPHNVLSPVEHLQQLKADYAERYNANSLRKRYAGNNDYIGFQRTIHDARYGSDQDAPAMPNASEWFPAERRPETVASAAAAKRLRATTIDAAVIEDDDDDDDVQIAGEKRTFRCPITFQEFVIPYSSNKCKHSYEKEAIVKYIQDNGVAEMGQSQGRRRAVPIGPKYVTCPESGCSARLTIDDLYEDQIMLRKLRRAKAMEGADNNDSMMQGNGDGSISEVSEDGGFEDADED